MKVTACQEEVRARMSLARAVRDGHTDEIPARRAALLRAQSATLIAEAARRAAEADALEAGTVR